MKSTKKLLYLILVLVLPSIEISAQEPKIMVSNKHIIKNPRWEVSIEDVVSNKYNEKGYLQGKNFIKLEGYSLAETLIQLSKYAGGYVEIDNLPENPPIVLTLRFENSSLTSVWVEALEEIVTYYKATLTETNKKVSIQQLSVVDRTKFKMHTSKKNEPGVLNASSIKDNVATLRNYSLNDLAQWLSDNYNYLVKANNSNMDAIDLSIPLNSWPSLKDKLLHEYGISVSDLTEDSVVYVVSY